MSTDISCDDIAKNMHKDTEFAYNVFSALAYDLQGHHDWFADQLFKSIFEEEDDDVLLMLNAIVKQFEHLKENIDDSDD